MIRTFQPVGSGSFVTERFESGKNVVVNCGSMASHWYLDQVICKCFEEGEPIEAVFLGALNREYAGGLESLMHRCRVRHVFAPYLNDRERAYTLLNYYCEGGGEEDLLSRLIMDPFHALSTCSDPQGKGSPVILVEEAKPWEKSVFDNSMPMDLMPRKTISGFRVCVEPDFDWVYQVQSYGHEADMDELTTCLQAMGVPAEWMTSAEALNLAWQEPAGRELLIQAYEQLKESFCAVAMAVYSGPEKQDHTVYEQFNERGRWMQEAGIRSGCMYTGCLCVTDPVRRSAFMRQFWFALGHTGCMVIPGHGRESLFHEDILLERNAVAVITVDSENTEGLPHDRVVRAVLQRWIPLYVVSELPGTVVRHCISEGQRLSGQ